VAVSTTPMDALWPIIAKLRTEGRLYPFHLGDSHLLPAAPARRIDLDAEYLHRYCPVPGLTEYRQAVATWVGGQLGLEIGATNVCAAVGCTGALSLIATTVFDVGDEVLVLTPTWPLISGILSSQGLVPVELPIGPDCWPEPDPTRFKERLESLCSERTAGLYFSDPNNPGGFVMPTAHLEVIREVALRRNLWIVIDVVYKDLILTPTPWQVPLLARDPDTSQRLLLAGSFSKSHVLAGHRAGFVIMPESLSMMVTRVMTHNCYNASTSAQQMAVAALASGQGEIERVRASYVEGLDAARATLRAPFREPEAGAFLFLDLRDLAGDDSDVMRLLVACLEAGVSLAPGSVFGRDYGRFARLCYTATSVSVLVEGLERLNGVLDR
jgi:aspartate/methionine/tyrosine aminotransferase